MKHALTAGATASAVAAVLMASPAFADGTPAGTEIKNVAEATYKDPDGVIHDVVTNEVTFRVDELLDVTVTSSDPGPVPATPGNETLTFSVTNTGNGPEAFDLNINPKVAGNDFDTTVTTVAIDTNGNGVYDPGIDTVLTGDYITPSLAPDQSLTVFVVVTVPNTVSDGDTSNVDLVANAVTGTGTPGTVFPGAGENGVDAVVGSTGATDDATGELLAAFATLGLVKSVTIADPFGGTTVVPGSVLTYKIVATATGTGTMSAVTVTDAYPAGTTYIPASIMLDSTALTDPAGDDAGESDATGITVRVGDVPAGTNHAVTFKVKVQ